MAKATRYRPPDLKRDHARPRTAPAPASPAVEQRLTDLVSPVAFALGDEYRRLGLRQRVLALPAMTAVVLVIVWRRIASVSDLVRTLAHEDLLWVPKQGVSQQAVSARLRTLPAALFQALLTELLPTLTGGPPTGPDRCRRCSRGFGPTSPRSGRWTARRWKPSSGRSACCGTRRIRSWAAPWRRCWT